MIKKYECAICKEQFMISVVAFDHVVEKHSDVIKSEYIVEV